MITETVIELCFCCDSLQHSCHTSLSIMGDYIKNCFCYSKKKCNLEQLNRLPQIIKVMIYCGLLSKITVRKPGTEITPTHSLNWHINTLGTLAAMSWKSCPVHLISSPRRKMGQYRSFSLSQEHLFRQLSSEVSRTLDLRGQYSRQVTHVSNVSFSGTIKSSLIFTLNIMLPHR